MLSRLSYVIRQRDSPSPIPQAWHAELPCDTLEFRRWAAPTQVIHRGEHGHVGPQRCQGAKQDRQVPMLVQRGGEARGAADRHFPLRMTGGDSFEMRVTPEDRA